MADVNLNEITDATARQRANTSAFNEGQSALSADYLKRFSDFINGQEGASAMAGRIGTELGIPTLRANAGMLRDTLTNLPTTYSKAMTGRDVNANQLSRIIGQKSSELAPIVETTERALSSAQNDLNTRMGYEQFDQNKALIPYQTEKDLLSERQARETTLYSQDNENELNALIQKMNMGVTISENEKNRANQLAIAERQYQQALELAKINNSNQAPSTPNTQIVESGGKKYLIDSGTGKIISTYGSGTGTGTNYTSYLKNTTTTSPAKSYLPNFFIKD